MCSKIEKSFTTLREPAVGAYAANWLLKAKRPEMSLRSAITSPVYAGLATDLSLNIIAQGSHGISAHSPPCIDLAGFK